MRLLKIDSNDRISLTDELLDTTPPYAILSHTWAADQDECTFEDIRDGTGKSKPGYAKIRFCAEQAKKDGLEYFWVDSVCINKANHAELSEAINSMFRWYREAQKCYVYLADVSSHKRNAEGHNEQLWRSAFQNSRWFTRGWTLQELLAPRSVEFFSREEELLGSKTSLDRLIYDTTSIPMSALQGAALSEFTVNERLSWAAKRNTKKVEDKFYSLLGIFDVFMNPIYGEGEHAWVRLKDAISRAYRNQLDDIRSLSEPRRFDRSNVSAADQRKELMASLSFDQMDSRRVTIKGAYSTTCQWLLEHPAYTSWIDEAQYGQHRGFLWISGKPGAGKSTLVKFIHAHHEKKKEKRDIIASFFFNARGAELEKSTSGMYRALLSQLLKHVHDLEGLLDEFKGGGDIVDTKWPTEVSKALLSLVVAKLRSRCLKVFIDALDECDEQEVRDMVAFFEKLGERAFQEGGQAYVCFSSRHYPTIEIRNGCQLTLENEKGHTEDLVKYVENHLQAGKGKRVEEVRALVTKKANGVFMWAVLVVDILNRELLHGRFFAVMKRLEEIPEKLSDLFKEILQRDSTNMGDLLLSIQWILFARRPLTPAEFYFAMVSGLDPEPDNLSEWNPEDTAVEDMHRYVLNSSKGLAEITRAEQPTVQFIHESVRDFLIKEKGFYQLWPEIGESFHSASHNELKDCCQNYLTVNAYRYEVTDRANSEAAKNLRQGLRVSHPFLDYASRHVLHHAEEAAREISQNSFLSTFDLDSVLQSMNLFEQYEIERHRPGTSMAYLLAENNLTRLIKVVASTGVNINAKLPFGVSRYRYPLFAALRSGHVEVVRVLLQLDESSQLDASNSGKLLRDFPVRKDTTPLVWALKSGQKTISEALVTFPDLETNGEDDTGRTALSLAAEQGFEKVVAFLCTTQDLDGNGQDSFFYRSPLSYAAEAGHTGTVQLLLNKGACVYTYGGHHPLKIAVERGHIDIVHLLLDRVYKTDKIDNAHHLHGLLLSHAAHFGPTSMMQLLLERGADINFQIVYAESALLAALKNRRLEAARLLLEQGVSVDFRDSIGRTVLFEDFVAGSQAACKLLLQYGADMEATDNFGKTALLKAIESRHIPSISNLLALGANVDAVGDDGVSGFVHVAKYGSFDYIWELLEYGTNIELADGEGKTALIHAVQNCDKALVQVLLSRGANVEAKDVAGDTCLFYATQRSRDPNFEVLLRHSANVDAINQAGCTPLIAAAMGRACDGWTIRRLIRYGASVDAKDRHGRTALSHTCRRGNEKFTKLLIVAGASVHVADEGGKTPLLWAATGNISLDHTDQSQARIKHPQDYPENRRKIIGMLLAKGARLNVETNDGETASMIDVEASWSQWLA